MKMKDEGHIEITCISMDNVFFFFFFPSEYFSGQRYVVTTEHSTLMTAVPHSNHAWKVDICAILYV